MGKYTQLKEVERTRIYEFSKQGMSMTMIGQMLGRNKSSISREMGRNSDRIGYLYPRDAQKRTEMRKARHGSKMDRNPTLKTYVLEQAKEGWPPGVISGRWNLLYPGQKISHEAIYQFAYREQNSNLMLWKLFPQAKSKRGCIRKKRATTKIQHRVSIHQRPQEIQNRQEFGHYEADLMFNRGSQSANVLTVVERKSRMVSLTKHESKHSASIIASIDRLIRSTGLSVTFDNGTEFADHHKLGLPTYFCDPGAPWQKGGVENSNKLARDVGLPFDMDPHLVTQEYLDQIAAKLNNKPRKILGYLTPMEVFMANKKQQQESRMKSARPAAEASQLIYQNILSVALHA